MPLSLVILAVSLFAFIIAMIGLLGSFFRRKWKWFLVLLLCVAASAVCLLTELYQMLAPEPARELRLVPRQQVVPL